MEFRPHAQKVELPCKTPLVFLRVKDNKPCGNRQTQRCSHHLLIMLTLCRVKLLQDFCSVCRENFQAMLMLCCDHTRSNDRNIVSTLVGKMFRQCWDYVEVILGQKGATWNLISETMFKQCWDYIETILGQTVAKLNLKFWENVQTLLRLSWRHVRSNGRQIKPHSLEKMFSQS